ncbi:B12-binding domain-containing radical SAM protein [Petrachloros mirabilis]
MKITLIQPENPYDIAYSSGLLRPLGLHLLASHLETFGFEVEVLDLRIRKNKGVPLTKLIRGNDSALFGITGFTAARFAVAEMARTIKQTHPLSCIVVGGWHFSHCAKDTLKRVEEIDIVVRGMGLSSLAGVAKAMDRKQSLEEVPSIAYRARGKVIENPERPFRVDIDEIPIYTRFSMDDYPERLANYPKYVRATGLYSSLGCPAACVFCSRVIKGYHLKDSGKFVDEIAHFRNRFNIEGFNFVDHTFTGNMDHVGKICREIISRNMRIKWWCESRVDVPLGILETMREAGCVSLSVGVESGSDRILARISKGITAEKVLNFCNRCNELGIYVTCFFMFSHPGETRADVNHTFELIQELKKYPVVRISTFQPTMIFPGSRLETIARQRNILRRDFSWYEPYDSELSRRLDQIPNIPLFIDLLKPQELIEFHERGKLLKLTARERVMRAIGILIKKISPRAFHQARKAYRKLRVDFLLNLRRNEGNSQP